MGFGDLLGMGGTDSSPSSAERSLRDTGQKNFKRYNEFFEPLNRDLERRTEQDREAFFQGRANADLMNQISGITRDANGEFQDNGRRGIKALAQGLQSASNENADRNVKQLGNAMKMRMGDNQSSIKGLSMAGETATAEIVDDLEEEAAENAERRKTLGSIAGYGAGKYMESQANLEMAKEDAIGNLGGGTDSNGFKRTVGGSNYWDNNQTRYLGDTPPGSLRGGYV